MMRPPDISRYMPHCTPQNGQWVGTRASIGSDVPQPVSHAPARRKSKAFDSGLKVNLSTLISPFRPDLRSHELLLYLREVRIVPQDALAFRAVVLKPGAVGLDGVVLS